MPTRITIRRDTWANWQGNNPVLAAGEPAIVVDPGNDHHNEHRTGDGQAAFLDLPLDDQKPRDIAAGKYTLPNGGMPETDMADPVRAALTTARAAALVVSEQTTTDTINAFLAAGGYRAIRGTAVLTKSLVIPSNTTLDATGATITAATTANLIQNAASIPQRTVTTGASTAGSTTLTAAGAAFSSADIGSAVQLLDAGPNAGRADAPGSWYGTIVSVTNATTVVVSTPASQTTSGKTLYVYGPRDSNIEIFGGIWRTGNKNSIAQTQASHGLRIRRADNVTVHDVTTIGPGVQNTGGQYAHSYGDVTRVTTYNLRFQDTNSDGVHFQGPASGIIVADVQGRNTGDDLVAFTGVDGQSQTGSLLGDTEGDITDVQVRNITGYGVWTHLKITGGVGANGTLRRVSKFTAQGIHGNSATGSPVNIVNYAGTTTFSGRIADVHAVGATTTAPQVACGAGNVLAITIDGVHWPATNDVPTSGVVNLQGTIQRAIVRNVTYGSLSGTTSSIAPAVYVSSASIGMLEVDGTYATDATVPNFIGVQIDAALTCSRLVVANHHSQADSGNAVYFTGTNWNIGAIILDRIHRKNGSWIDGTGTSTINSDITATNCDGGGAWILLRQPARISISSCTQTGSGAGIRLIGTTASAVISVAGSYRGGTLVSKDGTQDLRVAECVCIVVDQTLVTTAVNGDMFRTSTSQYLRASGAWKTL